MENKINCNEKFFPEVNIKNCNLRFNIFHSCCEVLQPREPDLKVALFFIVLQRSMAQTIKWLISG